MYLGDKHVLMINVFITNGMYLSFTFFVMPRASYRDTQCGLKVL